MENEHSEHVKNQLDMYPILLDRMPQGVATVNEEGIILFCNPSFAEMVSLPSEQVVGTKFQNYIAEISKDEFDNLYKQSWSGPIKDEVHLNDHVSIVMPVILSANTFELGKETLLSIILTDVSVRNKNRNELKVKAEELEKRLLQLQESEERFRLIVENVKDYSIIMLDPKGNIKTWNKGAERIKGYASKEIIGKHISIVYTKEELERNEPETNLKMAKKLGRYESEAWRVRKDGSTFFADVIITSLYDAKNKFRGYAKITRDITERKQAEEKLKESEERFLKIFSNSPVATTLTEIKTDKIAFANALFYDTFGYPEEEVIGKTAEELTLVTPEENSRVIAIVLDSFQENRTLAELQALTVEQIEELLPKLKQANALKDLEIEYTRKNGETFYAIIFYEAIRIGNKSYAITSYQDITDRKNAEEKVKQNSREMEFLNLELAFKNKESEKRSMQLSIANKELIFQIEEKEKKAVALASANTDLKEKKELIAHKDSILAILSHDLRSPLTGIIGAAKHLQANVEKMNPSQRQEILTLLYEASIKELKMLDYLVEWARVKYAADLFSPEQIKLSDCVKKVFDTLKDTAALHTVELCQEIEENSTVFADGKMLLSILQNIVSNAIKHSRPDGKITITVTQSGPEIVVEIKDTGIGMSEEIQKNLFTPQMDSLSKERKNDKGAGIGLLLVKGFLEKNGGRIWVESEEGVGSSFYFTLPINNPLAMIA